MYRGPLHYFFSYSCYGMCKSCSDHFVWNEARAKRSFHRIWIMIEKPLVKLIRALSHDSTIGFLCNTHTRQPIAEIWDGKITCGRHRMETFSPLLVICAGNSSGTGEFPTQRPVTRSFDVFFDLRLNKWLSKQSWGRTFETLSCPLWRYCNEGTGLVSLDLG